jgi:hypothetical protein
VVLLVDAALGHALVQYLRPLLALAAADDLADPWCQHVHRRDRPAVAVLAGTRRRAISLAAAFGHDNLGGGGNSIYLSAPGGGEGWGEWGFERSPSPTSPSRACGVGPFLSPLKGGEGFLARRDVCMPYPCCRERLG